MIIDAFQGQFHDAGWHALVTAGHAERSTLRRERSQLALPRLIANGFVADAAFVDGSNIFHNVFVGLFFLRELVVVDDCQWTSVATAVRYFELNTGWQPGPIAQDNRLRAYRLPDPPVEPNFESFVPFGLS